MISSAFVRTHDDEDEDARPMKRHARKVMGVSMAVPYWLVVGLLALNYVLDAAKWAYDLIIH